jgi:hypothetical protein
MNIAILLGLAALAAYALSKSGQSAASTATTVQKQSGDGEAKLRHDAQNLLAYVNSGGQNKVSIATYQKKIGAKTTGIADSQTEQKISSILGYAVNWAPKKKVAPTTSQKKAVLAKVKSLPKTTTIKKVPLPTVVEPRPLEGLLEAITAPTRAEPKPPKALPETTEKSTIFPNLPKVPVIDDSVLAANQLNNYLETGGLDRAKVKAWQKRIGSLTADGIPGPKTLARVSEVLKRDISWPAQEAAEDLRAYYASKGRDKGKIKTYQSEMGELTADGLVGPKTKARYKALTGKAF